MLNTKTNAHKMSLSFMKSIMKHNKLHNGIS